MIAKYTKSDVGPKKKFLSSTGSTTKSAVPVANEHLGDNLLLGKFFQEVLRQSV